MRERENLRNNEKVEMSDRCVNDLTILGFLHKMPSFLGSCAPFLVGNSLKTKKMWKRLEIKKYIYIYILWE